MTVETVAEMYKAAAKQAPQDPEPRVVLGVLHNLSQEYDDAVDVLLEATKIAPTDFTLWNKLGATLANASQPQEALYAYQKAIDIRPNYIRGYVNFGMAYQSQDRQDEAIKMFVKALQVGANQRPAGRHGMQVWYYLQGAVGQVAKSSGKEKLNELVKAAFDASRGSESEFAAALHTLLQMLD